MKCYIQIPHQNKSLLMKQLKLRKEYSDIDDKQRRFNNRLLDNIKKAYW